MPVNKLKKREARPRPAHQRPPAPIAGGQVAPSPQVVPVSAPAPASPQPPMFIPPSNPARWEVRFFQPGAEAAREMSEWLTGLEQRGQVIAVQHVVVGGGFYVLARARGQPEGGDGAPKG